MKQLIFAAILLIGLSIIFTDCMPPSKENGTISGTVSWRLNVNPCPSHPPDTCLITSIYSHPPDTISSSQSMQSMIAWSSFWPGKEAHFEFDDLPFGQYILAVEQVDSLFRMSKGKKGNHKILAYYRVEVDTTIHMADAKAATVLEISPKRLKLNQIKFIIR